MAVEHLFVKIVLAIWGRVCIMVLEQLNEMSSGQGENPDRRYSPRAVFRQTRCNSGTDSDAHRPGREVWMEEDVLKLRTLL